MEHIHRANENRLLILKIIVGLDCLLVIICGKPTLSEALTQLFKIDISYTHIIVAIYLIVFSIVIILSEFSPYISENYLTVVLPFLAKMLGRGIIMILQAQISFRIGTFLLDPFMGLFSQVIGVVTMICGIASIILHLLERNTDTDQYLPQTTTSSHQSNMQYDGFMKKTKREPAKDQLELDDYTPPQL